MKQTNLTTTNYLHKSHGVLTRFAWLGSALHSRRKQDAHTADTHNLCSAPVPSTVHISARGRRNPEGSVPFGRVHVASVVRNELKSTARCGWLTRSSRALQTSHDSPSVSRTTSRPSGVFPPFFTSRSTVAMIHLPLNLQMSYTDFVPSVDASSQMTHSGSQNKRCSTDSRQVLWIVDLNSPPR